jgi:hypothetical protein
MLAGCVSAAATASVWLLSLPQAHVLPDLFGYAPGWMFALLLVAMLAGIIASFHKRIWWVAVASAALSAVLFVMENNV